MNTNRNTKHAPHTPWGGHALFIFFLAALAVALLTLPDQAWAGKGGTAFNDVWDTLKDWIQGTLGRIVAGAMILVGVISGIARQSLMAFALGIGGGMGLYNAPFVVETVMSATLEETADTAALVVTRDNGLRPAGSAFAPPGIVVSGADTRGGRLSAGRAGEPEAARR